MMVDGVETDMSTVNPDDIESITVLKDASSTAVYGAPRHLRRDPPYHQKASERQRQGDC